MPRLISPARHTQTQHSRLGSMNAPAPFSATPPHIGTKPTGHSLKVRVDSPDAKRTATMAAFIEREPY